MRTFLPSSVTLWLTRLRTPFSLEYSMTLEW